MNTTNTNAASFSRDLAQVLASDDQSALLHDLVVSEDPPAGAWSRHTPPQSPLGRVGFPGVLSLVRGEVYTLDRHARLVEQVVRRRRWLPWLYEGRGPGLAVRRTIGHNLWQAEVVLIGRRRPGLALLQLQRPAGVALTLERIEAGLRLRWAGRWDVVIDISSPTVPLQISDDPAALKRQFQGFEDVTLNDTHVQWHWDHSGSVWLGARFEQTVTVRLAVVKPEQALPAPRSTTAMARGERKRWVSFFRDHVPALETDDPVLRDTWHFAWQVIWANRCQGGTPLHPHPFVSPARLHYASQWWWDEAFHTLVLRHLRGIGDAVYEPLANFFKAQAPDGAIPGFLNFGLDGDAEAMARASAKAMPMQPAVIGLVMDLLREKPGWPTSPQRLRALYEPLRRWGEWNLGPARDIDRDGLSEYDVWHNTSGDQSPRWDGQKVDPNHAMADPMRPTEAVDHNVWLSLLWENLAAMADALGASDDAEAHRQRAARTMQLIDERMWDETDGFYYDIDGQTHRKIRVKTPYGFMPLLSKHARADRVDRLVQEHLLNPATFWCRWPLPSVSLDHPAFDPVNMWRGPTWVNVNWMVIEGLLRQGYDEPARQLARRTVEMVGPRYEGGRRVRSPRIWEWYHPHTGEPLGNCQYGWTSLVVDLILRGLAGPVEVESAERSGQGAV
ncbi:MAG: trehalase family glycosidase [Phycisphaeraceae bacterium]